MEIVETLFLAALQGLTEFLPVSSSGHLVIARSFLGTDVTDNLALILVLHLGTAAAAALFYRLEVAGILRGLLPPFAPADQGVRRSRKLLAMIAAASIPTAFVGLIFRRYFESLFHAPEVVPPSLLLTGAVLFAVCRLPEGRIGLGDLSWWQAVAIGIVQSSAIVPGISRSGVTIAAGLLLGLRRAEAVEFSFLLLLPALAGAAILESFRLASLSSLYLIQSGVGFFASGLVGYAAIIVVLRWTNRGRLWYFGLYCWGAAAIAALAQLLA